MKQLTLIILGLSLVFPAYADDQCEPAVDAADSMNVNQKGCDYSDKGLNGFLQKAFKKGDEGAVLETTGPAKEKTAEIATATVTENAEAKGPKKSTEQNFTLNAEVDQWANLPVARAQLLPKALEQCGEGFAITGEHYRSLAMGRIELQLSVQCDR